MNFHVHEIICFFKRFHPAWLFIILFNPSVNFQSITFSQPNFEWEGFYPKDTSGIDQAEAGPIKVGITGNVYVGGAIAFLNGYRCFATVKYSPSGVQQWAATYFGQNTGGRGVFDLALDSDENVYVTGKTWVTGNNFDWCTIKYSSTGIQQWIQIYDSLHGEDIAEKIAVDNTGNIYVAGYTDIATGGGLSFTTIKYSTDGRQLWVKKYPVPTSDAYINGLLIDDSCYVYITGEHNGRALTIKYDSAGIELWRQLGPGYPNGFATSNSMSIDKFHNVYIAGENAANYHVNYFTIKYSASGVQQWMREFNIDTTQPSWNIGNCIAVDSSGNIYVSGSAWLNNYDPMKFCTIKYSNSGELLWARRDSTKLAGQGTFMEIDRDGLVYIGGVGCSSIEGEPCQNDFQTIIKYDSTGNKQWQIFGTHSILMDLFLDINNNIYITSGGNQLFMDKYSQLIGIKGRNSGVSYRFKLFQNYPNPFNSTTKIEFEIPLSNVTRENQYIISLKIYDILGKEVVTLIDRKLNAGKYKILWNASALPSGIYYYRLSAESYSESKKLVLIK